MKASCLTKWPWASRKCSGWKRKGIFHMVSSFSTDDRLVMSVVPWQEISGMGGCGLGGGACTSATKHTRGAHTLPGTYLDSSSDPQPKKLLGTLPVPMAGPSDLPPMGVLTATCPCMHGLLQHTAVAHFSLSSPPDWGSEWTGQALPLLIPTPTRAGTFVACGNEDWVPSAPILAPPSNGHTGATGGRWC